MIAIEQKIVNYSVVKQEEVKDVSTPVLNEKMQRPDILKGCTYKIKTPLSESSLYVTINNCEVNGQLKPFEIFINSKDMSHFQWIIALTRVMSAVFRKGGEVNFLIDELKSVHDPSGGAFHKGRYVPSLVSQIGDVVETHLVSLGLYEKDDSLQQAAVAMLDEKMKGASLVKGATLCAKCKEVAVILLDGCMTCTACGDSKCG